MRPKLLLLVLGISLCAMAQTDPRTMTPAQLAEQMISGILQHVELTVDQQAQITTTATTYFTNLRASSQATPETRTALSEAFQEDLKDIMTEGKYEQWKSSLQQQRQQRMSNNMSNQ